MRCVDVIHELETRRGGTTPGGLAEHLAVCPRCAARAEQMARLDRLWEATRPVEPPPAVWEAVWAKVSAAAAPAAPRRLMAPARPWHRAAIVGVGIAQATAILDGAALLLRQSGPRLQVARDVPPRITPPAPAPAVARVEVNYRPRMDRPHPERPSRGHGRPQRAGGELEFGRLEVQ